MKELVRDAAGFGQAVSMLIVSNRPATLRTPNAVDRSMIQILARECLLYGSQRRIVMVVMMVMVMLSDGHRPSGEEREAN